MSDLDILSDYNEDNLKTTHAEMNIMKLPKIHDSSSRANIQSKAEKRQINTLLPPLKKQLSMSQQNKKQLHKRSIQEINKHGDFVQDISEQLRGVIENVNKGTLQDDLTKNNQQQIDFENAIKLNKQKIKQFIQKNELNAMQAHIAQQKLTSIHKNQNRINLKSLSRNDSPNQIKNQRHRDLSAQRKYSISKKKDEGSKRQILSLKKIVNKQRQSGSDNKNQLRLPPKPNQKIKKSRPQSDLQIKQKRKVTVNLFDKIHNLFQKPRNRGASEMKIPNPQKIEILQKKIKEMNEKLGIKEIDEQQTTQSYLQQAKNTVLDWKRISYNKQKKLKCYHDSSFEKQMDKINSLQERSNKSLCDYVEQQIELVELGILKKIYPKIQNHTS